LALPSFLQLLLLLLVFWLSSSTVWPVFELKIILVMEFSYILYSELAEMWLSALTAAEKPCLMISADSSFLLISSDLKEDCGGKNLHPCL